MQKRRIATLDSPVQSEVISVSIMDVIPITVAYFVIWTGYVSFYFEVDCTVILCNTWCLGHYTVKNTRVQYQK